MRSVEGEGGGDEDGGGGEDEEHKVLIGKNVLCDDVAHLFAEESARKVPCTGQLRQ